MEKPAQVDGPLLVAPDLVEAGDLLVVEPDYDACFRLLMGCSKSGFSAGARGCSRGGLQARANKFGPGNACGPKSEAGSPAFDRAPTPASDSGAGSGPGCVFLAVDDQAPGDPEAHREDAKRPERIAAPDVE